MYSIAMKETLGLGVFADVVDRDDVRVREDSGGLRLADEALAELQGVLVVVGSLAAREWS